MTATTAEAATDVAPTPSDPYRLGRQDGSGGTGRQSGRGSGGPAPKRIVVAYSFWIFILSDIIMFSAFFAAYAVLSGSTAGGPVAAQLFELGRVKAETALLLASSFFCGMATISAERRSRPGTLVALGVTSALGAAFLVLEVREFAGMAAIGAGPSRSAFLSAFFALVGCHGLHVTVGLIWLTVTMLQVGSQGFRPAVLRRVACFALFWHALDIIWVALMTNVYLFGFAP